EGIDSAGNRIESQISAENSIAPLLAFNLHFDDSADNLILKALSKRRNASQLTENLISYLNWEEDITHVCSGSRQQADRQSSEAKPNSALKLLIEMFGNAITSKLFYYNDVRVIIDIIIRQLNNLPIGDKKRRVQSLSAASFDDRRSSEETEDTIRERVESMVTFDRKNSQMDYNERSDSPESEMKLFMGLCLPKTLFLIFEVESETHKKTNVSVKYETMKTPMNETLNIPPQVLNRREILRFVTNLGGAVHAKQAEQGLLNLKQKCSQAFEDICLYSEVSLQLSTYNFRMSARRFLQELFLDVHFDQIYTEADAIVRGLATQISDAGVNGVNKVTNTSKSGDN
ncbi:unnamed protein product, partial [Medioppia subpectinata]